MANKGLAAVAAVVALGGIGVIAFAGKLQTVRPAVTGQTLSTEVDATLREAMTGVHARAETLSMLPSLQASVSTDAETVRNQTQSEHMFQPHPKETITIGQVPTHGDPSVLLVLPENAEPAKIDRQGAQLTISDKELLITDVMPVKPSEAERAALLNGAIAIAQPVDVHTLVERLDALATRLQISADGKELDLGNAPVREDSARVPVPLTSLVGNKLRVVATVPTLASGPPWRVIGVGIIGLAVVLLGLGLRRPGPSTPLDLARAPTVSGGQPFLIAEGTVIDGTYEITNLLGQGGMGTVWAARHLRLPDKRVAVKLLTVEGQSEEHLMRFRREAEITSRLGHPNIVGVVDFNTLPSGSPYIVLELLEGEPLTSRIARGQIPLHDTLEMTKQIGSALHAAHRAGIVHRDLKPDNLFLVPTEGGEPLVKVLDFGISKIRNAPTAQTQDAQVFGTPQYMSPEQANGKNSEIDARTDVWALGTIVYEMLSGKPMFHGETMTELLVNVLVNPGPRLRDQVDVPEQVAIAIERATAKDPAQRWPDMPSFVGALTGG